MVWWKKIRRLIRMLVSIKSGTDAEGTIDEISENVSIRGSNIWMLVCSAMLSSLGLDLNSTAVIIGAMLISPLMSPILGVGLGVGILDRRLLRESIKNLGLATFISLAASFLYFFISPLGDLTPELSARTTPTILDVGIAFFGGIAGIVAGSRRNKTSAIPGVAIATALMPPICTAGFGLAKFSSTVFLGAFYLYFINAFFISLATYLIVILLKFPKRELLDEEQGVTVRRFIIGFAVLIIIPSGLIFYNVLSQLRFDRGVKSFVNERIRSDARQPVQWEIVQTSTPPTLKVYVVGKAFSIDDRRNLQAALDSYGLGSLDLKVVQLNVSPDEFQRLSSSVETDVSDRMNLIQSIEEQRKKEIEDLRLELTQLKNETDPHFVLAREIKRTFPNIKDAQWQPPATHEPDQSSNQKQVLGIIFNDGLSDAEKRDIRSRIARLAAARLPDESVEVVDIPNSSAENTPEPAAAEP